MVLVFGACIMGLKQLFARVFVTEQYNFVSS